MTTETLHSPQAGRKRDPGLETAGDLANVGLGAKLCRRGLGAAPDAASAVPLSRQCPGT